MHQEVSGWWTDEGRAYLKTLMQEFGRVFFGNTDFRINLVEHWRTYVAKYHKTSYKRARAVDTVDDVEEYDEEDTLLDLPDDNFEQMPIPFNGDTLAVRARGEVQLRGVMGYFCVFMLRVLPIFYKNKSAAL